MDGCKFVFAGELFAQAPVSQYPGSVVEAVTDSSRYFVIRIEDGNGKAHLANIYSHIYLNASATSKPIAGVNLHTPTKRVCYILHMFDNELQYDPVMSFLFVVKGVTLSLVWDLLIGETHLTSTSHCKIILS